MTIWQKIIIGIIALGVWLWGIWAKVQFTAEAADITVLIATAQATLLGLGITHLTDPTPAPPAVQPQDPQL